MKLQRYIAGLLLLCFSAFLGHNLVPHHHHSEAFHSPIATDCPFEHGDQQSNDHQHDADSDEHPLHCHAFNDVVFEKYSVSLNDWGTSRLLNMELPLQVFDPVAPLLLVSSPFFFLKLPTKSNSDLGSRALRGPPAIA